MGHRQGFDLFTKRGLKSFFEGGIFGNEWSRKHVWIDTFGHHICEVLGHSEKTYEFREHSGANGARVVCYRCNDYIADRVIEEEGG